MEDWSEVTHYTDWMNDYQKLLEYIKVEEILVKNNSRRVKELKYERKQIICLRKGQIIESMKKNI